MELSQGLLEGPRRLHLAARIKEEIKMLLNTATAPTSCHGPVLFALLPTIQEELLHARTTLLQLRM